jgi:PIN domain nuclease of toxin-antitoxin system
MGFFDAYALVALIAGEPAADEVEGVLRTGGACMSLVNLAEAVDVFQRRYGLTQAEIQQAVAPLELGGLLSFVAPDRGDAWLAGSLRAAHYDRGTRPVSLADCFLLAHAFVNDEPVVTSDAPLAAAARAERVDVVALPSTTGRRP